ncbi:MAG: hypothetical protein HFE76_17140, partial [Firmicutes bacterium]|nr:hypothetical protein [Bacillota bacterium]
MKKKLIAIVASLAMVATMVPASAFAASAEWTGSTDVTSKTVARLSLAGQGVIAEDGTVTKDGEATTLAMTAYGTAAKAEGWLPYVEEKNFGNGNANKGHYATVTYSIPKLEGEATGWALLRPSVEYEKLTGSDNISDPFTIWRLSKKAYVKTATDAINTTIHLNDYNGTFNSQVLFVNSAWDSDPSTHTADGDTGTDPNTSGTWTENYYGFTDKGNMPAIDAKNSFFDLKTLDKVIAAEKENVIGIANLSVDYSDMLLLSKSDTEDLVNFVKKANELKTATLNKYYVDTVEAVQKAYGRLEPEAVKAVTYSVDNKLDDSVDKAYKLLQNGTKNVDSYNNLNSVAALIKDIPTWKAEYASDAEIVAKVEAAQKAEKKLTDEVKAVLKDATNGFVTDAEYKNYEAAAKGINNKAVSNVVAKIDALTAITGDFADKAAVEAAAAAWKETYDAYDDLGALKSEVSNTTKLNTRTNEYKVAMEKYSNALWKEVSGLDAENGLEEEACAKVAELKSYIDNGYVNTEVTIGSNDVEIQIEEFDKNIYAVLVAALDKADKDGASLENATIAAIADQSYTGKAIEPAVAVTDKAGKEIAAEEYTVIYSNNKDAGTATVTVAAKSSSAYTGSVSATFTIKPAALTADMVKVANATYTGKAVKPAVSVASGVDYTVAYKNNTAVGKASAVVTGTGNYTGTITKNFIVKPAKESITSLKAGKKQI